MTYLFLAMAILCEVVGTTALKASNGFSRALPSAIVLVGYGAAFYFLSLCLRHMQVGVVYAVWSGLGIVLVTVTAAVVYRQIPDAWAVLGMSLIIAGVVVMNLMSRTSVH